MIEKTNKEISVTRQCGLVSISPSVMYYKPRPERDENVALMNEIDKVFTKHPYYGARRIQNELQREERRINIKRIRRLMYKMGIIPIYPKRNLSKSAPHHKKYPYLLRSVPITHCNQVWSIDITYIPLKKGFMYLVAVIDWQSRFVLSWKLSNTMTIEFCKECVQEAINKYGSPKIFNSDQGCQFTSEKFINIWKENNLDEVQISMDGRGRATDNAFIERVWRSLKYEKIYLNAYENGLSLMLGLTEYFSYYNHQRPHQSLNYKTPAQVYLDRVEGEKDFIKTKEIYKNAIEENLSTETSLSLQTISNRTQLTFNEKLSKLWGTLHSHKREDCGRACNLFNNYNLS